jgi:hypothetical protein
MAVYMYSLRVSVEGRNRSTLPGNRLNAISFVRIPGDQKSSLDFVARAMAY